MRRSIIQEVESHVKSIDSHLNTVWMHLLASQHHSASLRDDDFQNVLDEAPAEAGPDNFTGLFETDDDFAFADLPPLQEDSDVEMSGDEGNPPVEPHLNPIADVPDPPIPLNEEAPASHSNTGFDRPDPPLNILVAPPSPREVLRDSATHWFWRIIIVLTAWLNLHYHLPHRACILLLKVLHLIFIALGNLKVDDKVPVTLTTTFKTLQLNELFQIWPTCPQCHQLYATDSPHTLRCSTCDIPLFKFIDGTAKRHKKKAIPVAQCPRLPISSQLPRILNRVGVEEACDAWRNRPVTAGVKQSMMDGKI
jgi:hypothetical protein